jgi:hypothetical protein
MPHINYPLVINENERELNTASFKIIDPGTTVEA